MIGCDPPTWFFPLCSPGKRYIPLTQTQQVATVRQGDRSADWIRNRGGLMHPDTPWAFSSKELQALPGFGKDYETNLKEAKRLLTEAGYPDGFKTELLNRAVKLPYIDYGVYLITARKRIRVEVEHNLEESASWSKNWQIGNFAVLADLYSVCHARCHIRLGSPLRIERATHPFVATLQDMRRDHRGTDVFVA